MDDPYIEMRNGGYYVRGHRVSLDSVVYDWLAGRTPEEICEDFPTLTLTEVYGAIAYYLGHREEIDQYLKEWEAKYEEQRAAAQAADPERYADLRRRIAEARKRLEASSQLSTS
jgi:uncharacterized protein (DUF433 family)